MTQVLEQRYQASSRPGSAAVVMVAYDLMVVVTATIATGLGHRGGIPASRGSRRSSAWRIVIVHSVIGGMWSLTLTDIIQFVIKTVGIFLVLLLPIDGAGGLARMQVRCCRRAFSTSPASA